MIGRQAAAPGAGAIRSCVLGARSERASPTAAARRRAQQLEGTRNEPSGSEEPPGSSLEAATLGQQPPRRSHRPARPRASSRGTGPSSPRSSSESTRGATVRTSRALPSARWTKQENALAGEQGVQGALDDLASLRELSGE